MAIKIRLRQQGRRNRPFYRLVVADSRSPRDGKFIENLGWYNPHEVKEDLHLNVKTDRVKHWIDQGAELSEKAEALVKKAAPGVIQEMHKRQTDKLVKAAKKRRERKAKNATAKV